MRYCFGSRARAFDGSEQLDGAEIRDMAGHEASILVYMGRLLGTGGDYEVKHIRIGHRIKRGDGH